MKLNLGCGKNKKTGFINVDKRKWVEPDVVMDLEKKWKFKDNTVDEVFISHVIEHIKDLHHFMRELYRVCKDGAEITIIAPYWKHHSAFDDPDHCRFMTEYSFMYFNQDTHGSDKSTMEEAFGYYVDFKTMDIQYIVQNTEITTIKYILKVVKKQ